MNSQLGSIIIAGLKILFGERLKKAGIDDATIEKLVAKAVEKAVPAAIAEADEAIRHELDALKTELDALKLQAAFDHLNDLLRDTDDWFKPKGNMGIPDLDLPVEVVGKFDTSDSPSK